MKIIISTILTLASLGFIYWIATNLWERFRQYRKEDAVKKTLKKQQTKTKSK